MSYEHYGRGALHANPTVAGGRYAYQAEAERLIVLDIAAKLDLCPTDDLLEIGCGPGNLLIPLAFLCRSATGVDHPNLVRRLAERFPGPRKISLVPGNFLDVQTPDSSYSKIFMYAMLHYLSTVEEVLGFVHKAAALLRPGGRMLLGDLPNADHKRRFLATQAGRAFDERWRASRERAAPPGEDFPGESDDRLVGAFGDASIARIMLEMRAAGFESYVVEQTPDLPFGHTREDLLVIAHDDQSLDDSGRCAMAALSATGARSAR
jgi:SAM-dependent methyltransferase